METRECRESGNTERRHGKLEDNGGTEELKVQEKKAGMKIGGH